MTFQSLGSWIPETNLLNWDRAHACLWDGGLQLADRPLWNGCKLKPFQGQAIPAEAHAETLGFGDTRFMLTIWAGLWALYMVTTQFDKPLSGKTGQIPSLETS